MKIGGREVVHSSSMLIPDGEDAQITFNVGNWPIDLRVCFIFDDKKDKSSLTLEVIDNKPQLNLINWKNSLGTATTKPIEFGKTNNGQQLLFMVSHWYVGETNKIDIQFLLGGDL